MYPSSFGVNYFNDNIAAYNFIKDININNLTDNLGRPLSELYLTIVKNDNDADPDSINSDYWEAKQQAAGLSTDFWTDITAGYSTENNININYNVRAVKDIDYENNGATWFTANADPLGVGNIDESNNVFMGDIVEYNENELWERTLEDIYHRINTTYRENLNAITSVGDTTITSAVGWYYPGNNDYIFKIDFDLDNDGQFDFSFELEPGQLYALCYSDRCDEMESKCVYFEVHSIAEPYVYFKDPNSIIKIKNDPDCLIDRDPVTLSLEGCPCDIPGPVPLENKNEGYIYKPHKKIQIREFSSFPNTPVDLQNVYTTYNITSTSEQLKLKKAYGVPDYATEIGVGSNVLSGEVY